MSTVIETLERAQLRRVPTFASGDRVRVHFQVIEGTRRRTQVFEGVVIKRQGHGVRETFTVRKQSFGVGVERTFPVHSPEDRAHRGRRARRRPAGQALLPARARRQARACTRAPLYRPRGGPGGGRAQRPRGSARGRGRRCAGGRRRGRYDGGRGRRRRRRRRREAEPDSGEATEVVESAEAGATEQPTAADDAAADDATDGDAADDGAATATPPPVRQGVSKPEKSAGNGLVELVVIVAVALGLALGIQAVLVKPYRIPSESMVPTLEVGQRVLVNRIGKRFSEPSVGDVVVFHPPAGSESDTCGNPNSTTTSPATARQRPRRRQLHQAGRRGARRHDRRASGHVIRNGRQVDEPFIADTCERRRRSRLQHPGRDPCSGRALVHDGRQSWRVRRQPLLGSRPRGLGHRRSLRHVLAAQADRRPLADAADARDAKRRTGRRLVQHDRGLGVRCVAGADEAGRGCLAGPLVAAAVLFDVEALGVREVRALRRSTTPSSTTPRRARRSTRSSCGPR